MDLATLDDLRGRVLRGEDVSTAELRAALASMCSRPPLSGKTATAKKPIVPAFDALGFLKKRKEDASATATANAIPGETPP